MTEPLKITIRLPMTTADPETKVVIGDMDVTHYLTSIDLAGGVGAPTRVRMEFVKVDVDAEAYIDATAMGDTVKHYRLAKAVREAINEMEQEGALHDDGQD